MTTYYAVLLEECPRRIFNIVKLNLPTEKFKDLIMWQDRCAECAEFQKRRLGFSGFPSGWKSLDSVIHDMEDNGYRFDREYYFCRKFSREMVYPRIPPENTILISEESTPQLLDQLKPLMNEKNLKPRFYSMVDPNWIINFGEKHIGIYSPDKNGIPEFMAAPMGSQCGIVIFEGDISIRRSLNSFLELCAELDPINSTIIAIVPEHFNNLDFAIEAVRGGATTILRKGVDLLNRLSRVIDYSAPVSKQISRNSL
jgi:hypothetical protein